MDSSWFHDSVSTLELQVHQRVTHSLEVEERLMLKATTAEATCRRLASDSMTRSKSICDKVLEAVAALETKLDSQSPQVTSEELKVRASREAPSAHISLLSFLAAESRGVILLCFALSHHVCSTMAWLVQ